MDTDIVPENLDCMDIEDLRKAAHAYEKLARYANKKIRAMTLRLEGSITAALDAEQTCDDIYKSLPKEYRW